jgi:DNA-directed RNA polymerase subunit RPC12/RpoP
MGVEKRHECTGEYPVALQCSECSTGFWTDELTANDCPNCGFVSMTPRQVPSHE